MKLEREQVGDLVGPLGEVGRQQIVLSKIMTGSDF